MSKASIFDLFYFNMWKLAFVLLLFHNCLHQMYQVYQVYQMYQKEMYQLYQVYQMFQMFQMYAVCIANVLSLFLENKS